MAKKSQFPLTEFIAFMQDRGLASVSASMYVARVRSALRRAQPGELPTADELAQALLETDVHQHGVFRSAWKQYTAYLKKQGYKAAQLPVAESTDRWLDPVREALCELLRAAPMTPTELRLLTYGRIKEGALPDRDGNSVIGLIIYASAYPLAKRQPMPRLIPRSDEAATAAFFKIQSWGYPNEPPEDDSSFLPYGSDGPMPLDLVKRLCANATRATVPVIVGQFQPQAMSYAEIEARIAADDSVPEKIPSSLFDKSVLKPPD